MSSSVADKNGNATVRTLSGKKRYRQQHQSKAAAPIYVVVVESHQHVLEHIHTVLRRERLLTQEWSMLHFDSHPDLAAPNPSIPAKACFVPREPFAVGNSSEEKKNLYELLDSTSAGIAEWILPLVLAANLRRVHWVKPRPPVQQREGCYPTPPSPLPLGIHNYRVGAAVPLSDDKSTACCEAAIESFWDLPVSAVVKVDWPHPYYLEDGCTVRYGDSDQNQEAFLFPQPFELEVSELPAEASEQPEPSDDSVTVSSVQNNPNDNNKIWSLDICLDYFACHNPFLTDLEAIDPVFTRALMEAVYNARFYSTTFMARGHNSAIAAPTRCENKALKSYRQDLKEFRMFLVECLIQQQSPVSGHSSDNCWKKQLQEYYMDPEAGQKYLTNLIRAFCASSAYGEADDKGQSLIIMTEQALPNLTMPHLPVTTTGQGGFECERPVTMDSIRPALVRVEKEIESKLRSSSQQATSRDPFIITIARSSADGFTPIQVVDELQEQIIHHLHGVYCGCSNPVTIVSGGMVDDCRFRLLYDYGEWEGSAF